MIGKQTRGLRGGYLYTVAIIILMIPLILLLVFYTGVSKTGIENTVANIRCDELYYFVQDIESDMERAMLISGRRAAVYAIDYVVTNGRPMENYTYTNCTDFIYPRNGSEAAIAELILCGTLNGTEVEYMGNHTLPVWLDKINNGSKGLHYVVNLSVQNMTIAMSDAWNFAITLGANITVYDEAKLCYYVGQNFTLQSFTDIIGLEDTLYPLNTNNRVKKYIYNCSLNVTLDNLAGCSQKDWGEGVGAGNVVFYSDITSELEDFCGPSNFPEINDWILVVDTAFGSCTSLEEERCFNATSNYRFAGVIDYAKDSNNSFSEKCNITIPWISATGDITGDPTGHQRSPDCDDYNVSDGDCVLIKNVPGCDIHDVLVGYNASQLNTTCYTISNVTRYNESCNETYLNGPSFFDRLDGRLYLSDYYQDRSVELFNNPYIGIETLVSPYDLAVRKVPVFTNATWVDYLYWKDTPGCPVNVMCQTTPKFRLDCPHAYYYKLSTDCGDGGVQAFSEPPTSDITSPANGTTYADCSSISINGTADDCDGSISYVQLLIDGVPHDTTWDDPDWNYTFSTNENGIYVFQSRAVDDSLIYEEDLGQTVLFFSGCSGGDHDPPSAPTLVGPCGARDLPSSVTLDWNPLDDIYRYEVQVDTCNQEVDCNPPDWLELRNDVYPSTPPYELIGLENAYFAWRVRAQDNASNWGDWSNYCQFTTKK